MNSRFCSARFVALAILAGLLSVASAHDSDAMPEARDGHPLDWTLRYARSRADYIRTSVRDYTCQLVKRERIDGELQNYHFMQLKVRCGQQRDGEAAQPLSVYMRFLAPADVKGRRALYIEGKHGDKVLVRKGGPALEYLRVRIDPNGPAARRESNYPISEVGFDKIIDRLITLVGKDIEYDPSGKNTQVSHFVGARVNDRICTHIRVVHPKPQEGLQFHQASLYIDDELKVPIRVVVYGWPEADGEKPPLLEEYTYVHLQLNTGLTDDDFAERHLE
jgi:hypothetical protein